MFDVAGWFTRRMWINYTCKLLLGQLESSLVSTRSDNVMHSLTVRVYPNLLILLVYGRVGWLASWLVDELAGWRVGDL